MSKTNDIIDEAANFVPRIIPLNPRGEFYEKEELVPMFSFDRPASLFWQSLYKNLRLKGWTETEITSWFQSKSSRWALDEFSATVFDTITQKISDAAVKINDGALVD